MAPIFNHRLGALLLKEFSQIRRDRRLALVSDPASHIAVVAAGICSERRRHQHQAGSGG